MADVARTFGRAIIMPNLVPPVRNAAEADAYRQRILAARPAGSRFEPLMVLYLTDRTQPEEIRQAKASGFVHAAKLYPAGATTNSDSGVTSIDKILPAIEAMAEVGMPLLIHGEVTRGDVDVFDREKIFIDEHMRRVVELFPTLKVVFEHITTADAVQFVTEASANVGATITAHHLLYNRNHMLVGGIRPHFYCLPILKRNTHQVALLDAATVAARNFSSVPTLHLTPNTPRKPRVVVPVAIPPMRRSSCMPKRSNNATPWTSLKGSPASTAHVSMACRRIPTALPWSVKTGPPPPACRLAS